MLQTVKEILEILNNYIVYIYPGLLTLAVYNFVQAKSFKETQNTIIKSIAISYLYVTLLQKFVEFEPGNPKNRKLYPHIILLIISIILPYVFWLFINWKHVKEILKKLKISTNIHDNPLDIAKTYEKHIWLHIYMDDHNVMYAGYLRNHVSDLEKARYLMISQYQVSRFYKEKNQYIQIYPENLTLEENNAASNGTNISRKDWAVLDREKITRMEIVFENDH